jgi:hypothetical protein
MFSNVLSDVLKFSGFIKEDYFNDDELMGKFISKQSIKPST